MSNKNYNVKNSILKVKSHYSFFVLVFMVLFFSTLIQVVFFPDYDWIALYITFFPGLLVVYLITVRIYYVFYLFDDFILVKYPFKFKKGKEEVILFENIKYIEYMNDLRGPDIIVIHPIEGSIKNNKLDFGDFMNKKIFVFLRFMYSKGIEIDISRCAKKEKVLKKIKAKS